MSKLVTKNVLEEIQPHMTWLNDIDELKRCCWERACLRNFTDIPHRVAGDSVMTLPWRPLYRDSRSTCCGLPKKTDEMLEFLMDVTDDYANVLFDKDYDVVKPGNCRECSVVFKVDYRKQARFQRHRVRRNVVNAVLFIDAKNSYVHLHQTYKYKPKNVEVHILLQRIFREAIGAVKEYSQTEGCYGHFCTCDEINL
jgi:hypothetical protein